MKAMLKKSWAYRAWRQACVACERLKAAREDRRFYRASRSRLEALRSMGDQTIWDARWSAVNEVIISSQIKSELLDFLRYAAQSQPAVVVEIGSQFGGTGLLMSSLPTVSHVVQIDLIIRNRRGIVAAKKPNLNWDFVEGDSSTALTALARKLHATPIDVLFIDGDHNLAGVTSDFRLFAPLVRCGGLIAFHDIVPDYRTRGIPDGLGWAGDVPAFWAEIKWRCRGKEFVENKNQDGRGIGALAWEGDQRLLEEAARLGRMLPATLWARYFEKGSKLPSG
jgi:cephalosporin hydroxylase